MPIQLLMVSAVPGQAKMLQVAVCTASWALFVLLTEYGGQIKGMVGGSVGGAVGDVGSAVGRGVGAPGK